MSGSAAITGIGLISSLGVGTSAFVSGLREGRSGLKEITVFRPQGRCRTGGEVASFDAGAFLSRREARGLDRGTLMGVAAALEALRGAGLDAAERRPLRVGLSLGTCAGGLAGAIGLWRSLRDGGFRPSSALGVTPNAATSWLGRRLECRAPAVTFSTACSAGATALGFALDLLRQDRADVVVAGGYEPLCEVSFAGFECMRAFARDTIRPFDRERSGLLLGEGAALFVLERPELARSRGASVLGRILGYGASGDAFHTTMPEPSGEGAARAMAAALRDSGLGPEDIDHINAHGTGTRLNDPAESRAIQACFGARAAAIPVTSVKSSLGHTLGAAGALEIAASLLAANEGFIPPTLHCDTLDPECPLDVVANAARPARVRRFLSNSLGFGGSNVCLAVETAA
jgi:3-oxoacyl-[acyl-carrier-protein] synthase II